ncbi:MAG: alpha-L-fucosidase [Elusimicrobiota bacterium]
MSMKNKAPIEKLKTWQFNRFGMFIHWGLYSLPARHEWVKSRECITTEKYQRYFNEFNPDLYNPDEWASCAKNAGMKYVVLTAKHHEGFCLFDSKLTDYKSTNTPYGKDLLKPFVKAFRSAGIRVGLYYSLLDWHHPDYTLDHYHPMRNNPGFIKHNPSLDFSNYTKYLHGQVREILSNYGEIDMVFYDFTPLDPKTGKPEKGRDFWKSEELVSLTRKLQPGILINDRLDLLDTSWGWDFRTPEQLMLPGPLKNKNGKLIPWETCQTFSGSWGYHRDEDSWKSVPQLVRLLIDTVSKNGNLLLNIGPTARGEFDSRAKERLSGLGDWMKQHSRAIYGCTCAPVKASAPQDSRLTYNPDTKRLYIHIFSWPPSGEIVLRGVSIEKIMYAQLLNDASEIKFHKFKYWRENDKFVESSNSEAVTFRVPIKKPEVEVPVIELVLK